jgi:hypothetical protein
MGFASRFTSHFVLPILPNEHTTKLLIDYSKSSSSLPHPPNWLARYLISLCDEMMKTANLPPADHNRVFIVPTLERVKIVYLLFL